MTVAKALPQDLIANLLADYKKPEDLIGENGLLKQITKALVERALEAEMEAHLGHGKNEPVANASGNTRNGKSKKTLKGEFGELPIEVPRDRQGSFEPQLITKHQTRWSGFDDKILSLYAPTELKNRGVLDIFIACVDGLKGFPEAIETVFPRTDVQLCIVHMVRYSLNYVSWKLRGEVATDLRAIYSATTVEDAEQQLAAFAEKWGEAYPPIVQSWQRNWARIIPFFDYPAEIRKVIYTTNAIESVNMSLRKITKNRGSFPSDEALLKLFYLALNNISKKWTMPIRDWKSALNRFTIQFEDRMPQQ